MQRQTENGEIGRAAPNARKLTPNQRRRRASRAFALRAGILIVLMATLAYCAWLAPWNRYHQPVSVETVSEAAHGN